MIRPATLRPATSRRAHVKRFGLFAAVGAAGFLAVALLGTGRAAAASGSRDTVALAPTTRTATLTSAATPALRLRASSASTATSGSTAGGSTPSNGTMPPGIGVGPNLWGGAPPTTPGPSISAGGSQSCGFFDVTCHVTSAIDGWFRDLVTSALNPVLALLGRTVLATPDVTGGKVGLIWGVTAGIANALVVLLVLAGGAVVMSHETLQTRYAAKDIAPRVVVAVIAANASLALVGLAIPVANALSAALLGNGVDPAQATAAMRQLVLAPLGAGGIFLVLLGLVAAVLAVVLLATYVIRVALLVLLVAVAPLALIGHALPQTEGPARLWWRAVAGLFAIQLGQSLVLICALKVFFTPSGPGTLGLSASGGLVDVLVAVCLLWVLVRIPAWVSRAVFGAGRSSGVAKAFKVAFIYKAARAGLAALA
jgi:hypothetical protein